MSKTLHYVIRVTVPERELEVYIRDKIIRALKCDPRMIQHKPRVWRPRGKVGDLLRDMDTA